MGRRPRAELGEAAEEDSKDPLLLAFGKKVREARTKAGLTQGELGDATGFSQSYVFEMEMLGRNVTLRTLAMVASALRMGIRDLVPENEFDTLNPSSVAVLSAALDRMSEALAAHRSHESELLGQLEGFTGLRERLAQISAAERNGEDR
jgi:transcriptional regulator with XRE-family HTH domain